MCATQGWGSAVGWTNLELTDSVSHYGGKQTSRVNKETTDSFHRDGLYWIVPIWYLNIYVCELSLFLLSGFILHCQHYVEMEAFT